MLFKYNLFATDRTILHGNNLQLNQGGKLNQLILQAFWQIKELQEDQEQVNKQSKLH